MLNLSAHFSGLFIYVFIFFFGGGSYYMHFSFHADIESFIDSSGLYHGETLQRTQCAYCHDNLFLVYTQMGLGSFNQLDIMIFFYYSCLDIQQAHCEFSSCTA